MCFAPQVRACKGDDVGARDAVMGVLREWPFETEGDLRRVPVGLRLHALDVWADECEAVGVLGGDVEEEEERAVGRGVGAFGGGC